jgi:hypothetical protein
MADTVTWHAGADSLCIYKSGVLVVEIPRHCFVVLSSDLLLSLRLNGITERCHLEIAAGSVEAGVPVSMGDK